MCTLRVTDSLSPPLSRRYVDLPALSGEFEKDQAFLENTATYYKRLLGSSTWSLSTGFKGLGIKLISSANPTSCMATLKSFRNKLFYFNVNFRLVKSWYYKADQPILGAFLDRLPFTVQSEIVVVSGKQRQVRLVPIRALDGDDTEWIKVTESKGCAVLTVGPVLRAPLTFCLCIAIKKQNSSVIIIYEITRTRTRHQRVHEIGIPVSVQALQILSDGRLCVGSLSCFTVYNIQSGDSFISLLHPENPLYATITCSAVDALRVIELPRREYLLVFGTLAAYVDKHGRKSRDREIMYPAVPTAISYRDGHLVVYSETHIDIFNCATGEWVQTLNIKRAKPLNDSGSLTLCILHDLPHLLYLSNVHQRELLNLENIVALDTEGRVVRKPRRRFSIREGNRSTRTNTDRRSKLISAPTNFNHISHVGPGDSIQ
ncbi:serine/threonine-protein kinase Genghis Khan-like [Euwallacea similis]|uniref:serine/threonine-protein kinase Genghis Khan-like n=1 Tax=Euwallacea similis TaxID=1736056 RepID=UPI00344CF35B